MNSKPIETKTCECCGSTIGTYRFTVTVEFYMEIDVDATCPEEAVRKVGDELTSWDVPAPPQWFGGDLRAYDMDDNKVVEI